MKTYTRPVQLTDTLLAGADRPVIIAGPCAAESSALCIEVATRMQQICRELELPYIFKASFDKANRTSIDSYRGRGLKTGLKFLAETKETAEVPILTDIHLPEQALPVAEVADVLQIPAFLCRQTDLLLAAGETGKPVNIKRGQFMAPEDMFYAREKVASTGNTRVLLTERGVSFGYHNLVVDMRALPVMRQYAPVLFDATHAVQQPGAGSGESSGTPQLAPYLARAAAATGIDGFFIETHPTPKSALSDGPNMIPLAEMPKLLGMLKDIWQAARPYTTPAFEDEDTD